MLPQILWLVQSKSSGYALRLGLLTAIISSTNFITITTNKYRQPHGFECNLDASCNYWPIAVKLHSNPCGYLLIMRHLANSN